jgi:hypothetical protein
MLLRGVKANCPFPVQVMVVTLPHRQLKPWYLLSTDLELPVEEAVEAYMGRPQIETNVDEVKELGLGNSMWRSRQGVRRWPLFLCVAQLVLKFMTTEEAPNPDSAPEKMRLGNSLKFESHAKLCCKWQSHWRSKARAIKRDRL